MGTKETIIGITEGMWVDSVMYSSFLGIARRLGTHMVPEDGDRQQMKLLLGTIISIAMLGA